MYENDTPPQERAVSEYFHITIQNPERYYNTVGQLPWMLYVWARNSCILPTKKLCSQIFPKQVGESRNTICDSSLTSGLVQRKTKMFSLPPSVLEKEHGPRVVLEQMTVLRRRGQPPEVLCLMASKSPGRWLWRYFIFFSHNLVEWNTWDNVLATQKDPQR